MIWAYVKGLGLWTGDANPPCKVVDSRLGRGTSHITRMAIECVDRAGTSAKFDMAQIGTVFGSALGELEIAIEQLDMMLSEEGIVSPARFKNSVHNTAAGVMSIATKNRGFTTAIAAGDHTVAAALLEAILLLDNDIAKQAVAVVVDEAPPEPIGKRSTQRAERAESGATASPERDPVIARADCNFDALGVAFALDRSPEGALAKITLAQNVDGERLVIPESFHHNPCAPALGLLQAVEAKRSGTYVLSAPPLAQGWSVRVECNR